MSSPQLPDLDAQPTEVAEGHLLGVPVRYASNSPAIAAAAAALLAPGRALPARLQERGEPVRITVLVAPASPGEPEPAGPLAVRAYGDTFVGAGAGVLFTAHTAAGEALAFVAPELACDGPALRREVLERLGLLLVSGRDRAPLRATAVARGGHAVLLVGGAGVDKAALGAACAAAGLAPLAEERVYVSLAHGLRVWGWPESSAPVERALACVVERAAGQASRVEGLARDEAAARLAEAVEPGPGRPAVAAALAAGGAYRLTVGSEPASAAALLAHLLERP
jgi:hypothetical protein